VAFRSAARWGNDIYLPDGQFPSKTEDPRLQIPFNAANFTLPAINSLGHREHASEHRLWAGCV
jgi:hypothetical protein